MSYHTIAEGFVTRRPLGGATSAVAGPRCVVSRDGQIVCTFIAQSALGINDFKPMMSASRDRGLTWSEPRLIWPELVDAYSIFGSVSSTPAGDMLFYGTRTPIESTGEKFWSDATQGLKQNELIWSRSTDGGVTWSDLAVIPMPVPGSAEAPGAMCATRDGRLVCCYAPYNTFDPHLKVQTHQIVCLWSADDGKSWHHSTMLQFPSAQSMAAEAWVVELTDGRLLGTAWHIGKDADAPNAYAISHDSGASWSRTLSTEILGQSTALAPLPSGRALFLYNQRKKEPIGVWMAVVDPSEAGFGILENRRVWAAARGSRKPDLNDHKNWTDFAFGEPAAVVLPNNEVLVTLWASHAAGGDIAYVKLQMS